MKPYKQILVIELKDGTTLNSNKTIDELQKYLEGCKDICLIDGVLFNKYEFKKAYEQKIDGIQSYILSFPKEIQEKLKQREKEKQTRVGRGFDSIQEINNRLKENCLIISG